jgi:hypothetical protein
MRVQGEHVASVERNLPLSDDDRVCDESGCVTKLSVYNDQDSCALHAPMVVPRMRGKVLDE